MEKILIDKILLIVMALVGFALTFFIIFFGEKSVGKEWAMFIFMSMAYLVMLFVGAFPIIKKFKQTKRIRFLIYLGIAYILTVGSAYIVFVFNIFPMPERHRVYIIAMIILGTITIGSLEYFVKKMRLRKIIYRNKIQMILYDLRKGYDYASSILQTSKIFVLNLMFLRIYTN